MFVALCLTVLSAAPAKPVALPKVLPTISAPLGRLGNVVEEPPKGGMQAGDPAILVKPEGCSETQAIFVTRAFTGSLTALQQFADWFRAQPAEEKRLFGKKGVLDDVSKTSASAGPATQQVCDAAELALKDGFRLGLLKAPAKLCELSPNRTAGDFWYVNGSKPAAIVEVQPAVAGAKNACLPRISIVLFDSKGLSRVALHADFNGVLSATLLGQKCQALDFTLDSAEQAFRPTWGTAQGCKP